MHKSSWMKDHFCLNVARCSSYCVPATDRLTDMPCTETSPFAFGKIVNMVCAFRFACIFFPTLHKTPREMSQNFINVIPTHEAKFSSTDKTNYFITPLFCAARYTLCFILGI